jgi:hypothetical protein
VLETTAAPSPRRRRFCQVRRRLKAAYAGCAVPPSAESEGRVDRLPPMGAGAKAARRSSLAGERITERIVSPADSDGRPLRKGKIDKPTEFGYVSQPGRSGRAHRAGRAG